MTMRSTALSVFAGFWLVSAAFAAEPGIAVTFDDLPSHGPLPPGMTRTDIAQSVIDSLKAAGVPPTYGFVNAVALEREPASAPVLKLWVDSGNLLGNHTWSHPGLSKLTDDAYETEIVKNEKVLSEIMGSRDWHWFRYPFLDEGKDATQRATIRGFLAARGYKVAGVSMGISDWLYNPPYVRCLAKHDDAAIAQMEKDYLTATREDIAFRKAASEAVLHRQVPLVYLVHIGAFEARMLPKVLAMYRAAGFRFISLDEAESDPYYKAIRDPGQPAGSTGLNEDVWKTGKQMPNVETFEADLDKVCR